jgi:hypothetical protein
MIHYRLVEVASCMPDNDGGGMKEILEDGL